MKPDRYSIIIAFAHNAAISKASHYYFGYRGKFFPFPKTGLSETAAEFALASPLPHTTDPEITRR
jgi:hypothetical protein